MWLVGITESSKESYTHANLERYHGLQTYLPKFVESYIDHKKHAVLTRVAPLFPRYLFIETDGHWRFLLPVFGMCGVVRHPDETPVIMPQSGIDQLKSRENKAGYIELPPTLARRFKPQVRYHKGQRIRVNHGPMVGFPGICLGDNGKARVAVLLNYLGRSTPTLVPRDALIAA
jgi:transcription antitermination factor NusG